MKILIATGGTGGHLYPALALVSHIEEQIKDCQFLFVGTKDRLESEVVPNKGYDYKGMDIKGISGNLGNKAKAVLVFIKSLNKSKQIIKEFNPDIVVGFGGYVSSSIVLAATKLKIPTLIHEQNSIIGLANKILIKHVDGIVACYQLAYDCFPKEKTKLLGNPRASEVHNARNNDIYEKYDLIRNKKIVFIVMGSLGSSTINKVVLESLDLFKTKDYQVVFVTGKKEYENVLTQLNGNNYENIKILPYVDDMLSMLSQIDLIISRAGASTIAEITSLGIPSILVPSPYVASNHQEYNAKELVFKDAARMILEKDLNKTRLVNDIDELLSNSIELDKLRRNAKGLGKPNASEDIYQFMLEIIGK